MKRAATEGHFGNEGWHKRKDGTQFWANVLTVTLRDKDGNVQGFARVVRDFSDRQEKEEKLRRSRARLRPRRRNLPSPALFPESLIRFQRRTMPFSIWSATPARICWPGGCTGRILLRRSILLSTNSRMKRACGSAPVLLLKKS